jgi:hypothetical protein
VRDQAFRADEARDPGVVHVGGAEDFRSVADLKHAFEADALVADSDADGVVAVSKRCHPNEVAL